MVADYVDLGWRAALAVRWLGIAVFISLLVLLIELRHAAVVGDASAAFAAKVASEDLLNLAYLVQTVVLLITPVIFLLWFFRAYHNLPGLGARGRRFGAIWAIFSWFVPILNLVLPKKIANDLWRAGDPDLPPEGGHRWHGRPVAARLHWWWALLLLVTPLNRIAGSSYDDATSSQSLRDATLLGAGGSAVTVAGLVLAAVVVASTTRRLQARAETMRTAVAAGGRPGEGRDAADHGRPAAAP